MGKRDEILPSVRMMEARLVEIAELKKHILNYSRTRSVYEDYRKAGYSKMFFEAHREELTLHKAAKNAFDESGLKKIPGHKGTERGVHRSSDGNKAGLCGVPADPGESSGVYHR